MSTYAVRDLLQSDAILLACWVILLAFFRSADFFLQKFYQKYYKLETIKVSNRLDPDQARHFVGPDLDPNCLQRLSADNSSRQRV